MIANLIAKHKTFFNFLRIEGNTIISAEENKVGVDQELQIFRESRTRQIVFNVILFEENDSSNQKKRLSGQYNLI